MQNLAFMVDISQHLNNLNKMLQGCKRLVTQYYDTIGCMLKLSLWKTQLSGDHTVHFLCLKRMRTTGPNIDLNQYKDKITELLREFKQRFQIFDQLETFTLNASDLPVDLQLGIIDLQCDSNLKTTFVVVSLVTYISVSFSRLPMA